MLTDPYNTTDERIVTPISGGREHFTYRQPVRFSTSYPYNIEYGQNFHFLAAAVFGDDRFWWALYEANPPKYPDEYVAGDTISLPSGIVNQSGNVKKFF